MGSRELPPGLAEAAASWLSELDGSESLSPREACIVFLLYGRGDRQREAAEVLGVSQQLVAKIAKDAVKKLRAAVLLEDRPAKPIGSAADPNTVRVKGKPKVVAVLKASGVEVPRSDDPLVREYRIEIERITATVAALKAELSACTDPAEAKRLRRALYTLHVGRGQLRQTLEYMTSPPEIIHPLRGKRLFKHNED